MSNFALLWGKILRSSLWINGTKEMKLLWITLLALKDENGVVQSSLVGLADMAKITPDECRESLKAFLSPDPDDTSGVDEGRRLRVIPGGWEIVNSDLYRFSTEAKREFWRQQKADQRLREKASLDAKRAKANARSARRALPKQTPSPGEKAFEKAVESGNEALADHLTEPKSTHLDDATCID